MFKTSYFYFMPLPLYRPHEKIAAISPNITKFFSLTCQLYFFGRVIAHLPFQNSPYIIMLHEKMVAGFLANFYCT